MITVLVFVYTVILQKHVTGEVYSPEGDAENAVEDLDIDSLLQANLGAVNITDILNISECDNNFLPTDLPDLSMLEEVEAENEKVRNPEKLSYKIFIINSTFY